MPSDGLGLYRAAAVCCAVLAVACVLFCGRGQRRWAAFPALVAAGMMCWITDAICGNPAAGPAVWASTALGRLCGVIDSCTFSHESTRALARALLTGDRTGLDYGTVAVFRKAGAAHILALSGLHLGIIYAIISALLSVTGNTRAAAMGRSLTTVALCACYTFITGAGASTVRALLFIIFREISVHNASRRHSGTDILCTALTIHLLLRPSDVESLGFQLSYLAMLGIFEIAPLLRAFWPDDGGKIGIMRRIWDSATIALACQMTTAPLLWFRMGVIPGHFLLTNILALPLAEGLIVCSVAAIAAAALGIPSETAESLTDHLAQALLYVLEIISGM